jgi:RND superfamily putative drug exporter
MGLPLLTAVFGLGMSIALGELLRRVVDVPDWATATAAMVGHRRRHRLRAPHRHPLPQQPRRRPDPRQATLTAIATAGRAVVFAGLTVVVAMLGILLVGQPALAGFAFTASLFVLVTMTASLTLLPALLGFAGRNIERLHVPFVTRNSTPTTPHAGTAGAGSSNSAMDRRDRGLAVLLALAAPLLGMRLGFPDAQNDPKSLHTHQAYDLIADGFGPGFSAPLVLTVQGASGTELLTSSDAVGTRARRGQRRRPSFPRPSSTKRATPPS